ncbi:MAG: hypothetical protein BVN34_06035 [Proteobacteria bacterium ST_bin12]|nr:MAG: hypothetical protein BVN34_06035 [Proteobacteria bacterium ST_bin12]
MILDKLQKLAALSFCTQRTTDQLEDAVDAITLCAAEKHIIPAPIIIEKQLARFTGCAVESIGLERTLESLFITEATFKPTKLLPFGRSYVFGGGAVNCNKEYFRAKIYPSSKTSYQKIKSAILISNSNSEIYYGDWFLDELPAAKIDFDSSQSIAFRKPDGWQHSREYLDIFNIGINYGFRGIVENLYLLTDSSQNSYKQNRYQSLRQELEQYNFQDANFSGTYILRGSNTQGAPRVLDNENELIAHLKKQNFNILDLEKMSAKEIVKRLWNTPMVIGVEGSALTHAILPLRKFGSMLVIQSPKRLSLALKGILDARNNPFGMYVCKPSLKNSHCFSVDSFSDIDFLIEKLRVESYKRYINSL